MRAASALTVLLLGLLFFKATLASPRERYSPPHTSQKVLAGLNQNIELKNIDVIKDHYTADADKCPSPDTAVTNLNAKVEFWQICTTTAGNRLIQIQSYIKPVIYKEVYYEYQGRLIYAIDSELYTPINHRVLQPWTVQFYIVDEKVIFAPSLGHGKTEEDNWDPKYILSKHRKRRTELNNIMTE